MALQGTIKDFSLSEIFQLIGIQRKTGILTLENDEDAVTVHFCEGQVVGADTRLRNLEDLLGGVLVRTGRITDQRLQEALKLQKRTLKRLGYVLVEMGAISETELREALQVQVTQIVYRLFRWRDGRYQFTATEHIDYDREHFVPVSAETILMEGARMVDEWPIIERKIRSVQMVFQKTPAAAALEAPVQSLVDTDIALDGGGESRGDALSVTPEERELLRRIDGQASVQDLVDRSPLGEFDVYHLLYELLNRHLIEEVTVSVSAVAARSSAKLSRLLSPLLLAVLLVLSLGGLAGIGRNPWNPWSLALAGESTERLNTFVSRGRLERIERALELYYLDRAGVPDWLGPLATQGYLPPEDLVDPWDRSYEFSLQPGGYRLAGLGADGQPSAFLTLQHRFSPSQRMVLAGTATPAAEAAPTP